MRRHEAGRAFRAIETPFGQVDVKLKLLAGRVVGAMPEFESVRERAEEAAVPVARVHAAAASAAMALVDDQVPVPRPLGARHSSADR